MISKFNLKANLWIVYLGINKALIQSVPVFVSGILILSGLNHWFTLPTWIRQIFWSINLAAFVAVLIRGFVPFRFFTLKAKSTNLFNNLKMAQANE
ncbi:MAG: hypothetical protein LHV69_12020, partial [Elusimicrobia bacterium]|nr:hypothetical protein [Candidatus Obscuribacterium magneticum]